MEEKRTFKGFVVIVLMVVYLGVLLHICLTKRIYSVHSPVTHTSERSTRNSS